MTEPRVFEDRSAAGRELASHLAGLRFEHPIVFGLVRGGIEVAAPVARALGVRLEPLIVRKVGHPSQPELGVGAIAPDGEVEIDPEVESRFRLDLRELEPVIDRERAELARRQLEFTGGGVTDVRNRFVIVADDGIATGSTALVAGAYLRRSGASKTILAVPVCPPEAAERLRSIYNEVICLQVLPGFRSVGQWYSDFTQLTDEDVRRYLLAQPPIGLDRVRL